ncbi:MAG TPA: GWxTD domain-containing protein [Acidobacteriota bacterium]|nr:GWxTD domain-containing protein [Acidobacteriota bacterium]
MKLKTFLTLMTALILAGLPVSAQDEAARQEESEDYFQKWLEEDVLYIITAEERAVFEDLRTEEEKVRFIEAFWKRRDPDPRTAENSFKEEHYRRIAYANERFSAGIAGWKTDRGRVYIRFGPPTQRDVNPTGTTVSDNRGALANAMEGRIEGGVTPREMVTFPFEVWYYNRIEGIGSGITLEFVDRSGAGLYELALDEDEKNVYGYRDPLADPASVAKSDLFRRSKERQFYKTELLAKVDMAPTVQFEQLAGVVSSRVTYDQIPFRLDVSQLRVTESSVYVPVTFSLPVSILDFKPLAEGGVYKASVNIFIQARDLSKRITAMIEDTLELQGTEAQLEKMRRGDALYSKKILLTPGRHVLDIVLKDNNSGKLGTKQQLVHVQTQQGLSLSSLILADVMRPLMGQESLADPFVVADHKVVPNVGHEFQSDKRVGLFFQIYGLQVDQSSQKPSIDLVVRFKKEDRSLVTIEDDLRTFGKVRGDQASVTISLPLSKFPSGKVEVEVEVKDRLSGESADGRTFFNISQADKPAS